MEAELWPPEWQRGLLEFIVLAAVSAEREPTYGYRIVQRLEASGLGRIKGGTLYPILARLEVAGFTSSHWGEGEGGPGRKFVTLTEAGKTRLTELEQSWASFSYTIGALVAAGVKA